MSRENVELIERALEHSHDDPTAVLEILDDEARWEMGSLDLPDGGGSYQGPAAVREFFRRWTRPFDEWDYEVCEVIDAGDSVLVYIRQWGRGKGSGVVVENRFWQLWTLRQGKVVRTTHFSKKAEALEAAGLRE